MESTVSTCFRWSGVQLNEIVVCEIFSYLKDQELLQVETLATEYFRLMQLVWQDFNQRKGWDIDWSGCQKGERYPKFRYWLNKGLIEQITMVDRHALRLKSFSRRYGLNSQEHLNRCFQKFESQIVTLCRDILKIEKDKDAEEGTGELLVTLIRKGYSYRSDSSLETLKEIADDCEKIFKKKMKIIDVIDLGLALVGESGKEEFLQAREGQNEERKDYGILGRKVKISPQHAARLHSQGNLLPSVSLGTAAHLIRIHHIDSCRKETAYIMHEMKVIDAKMLVRQVLITNQHQVKVWKRVISVFSNEARSLMMQWPLEAVAHQMAEKMYEDAEDFYKIGVDKERWNHPICLRHNLWHGLARIKLFFKDLKKAEDYFDRALVFAREMISRNYASKEEIFSLWEQAIALKEKLGRVKEVKSLQHEKDHFCFPKS